MGGVVGVICLQVLLILAFLVMVRSPGFEPGLLRLVGSLVELVTGGCYGRIVWVGCSGLRLEELICMCGSLLIWVGLIS